MIPEWGIISTPFYNPPRPCSCSSFMQFRIVHLSIVSDFLEKLRKNGSCTLLNKAIYTSYLIAFRSVFNTNAI